jgi:DNA mismatch repair protein MutS
MRMIDEYFDKDRYYKSKYGKKTFLLYQVGSFFELYGIKNNIFSMENIESYSDICGLSVASKQICVGGNPGDQPNIVMAGFRDYILDKYIEKIQPHGYTVIVYIQEEKNGSIIRYESGVYSPGTTFMDNVSVLSNNISCLWIQKTKTTSVCGEKYIFGLSNINIFNGKSNLCEYYEIYYHNPTSYDKIEKFLNVYSPIETIIIHNLKDDLISSIIDYLQLESKKHYVIDLNNDSNELSLQANNCENQVYQAEIIKKYFPGMDYEVFRYSIEDKPVSLQSFCFLLNFIGQHNACLIEKISDPLIEDHDDILVCANHSLKQLNIIGENVNYLDKDRKINGMLPILNKCITKIGKRGMNDMLLNPICNSEQLERQYSEIEHVLKKKYNFDDELKQVKDLEKIMTKIKLKKGTPIDIYSIYDSSWIVDRMLKILKSDKKTIQIFGLTEFLKNHSKFDKFIESCLRIEVCRELNHLNFDKQEIGQISIIKEGYNQKFDSVVKQRKINNLKLESMLIHLESLFVKKDKDNRFIQQYYTPSNELCLLLTKKRGKMLESILSKLNGKTLLVGDISFTINLNDIKFRDYNKSKSIIYSDQFDGLLSDIYASNDEYCKLSLELFQKIILELSDNHYDFINEIIQSIRNVDIINTKVNLIRDYNLCRPKIVKSENSFVDARQLRHLLIETLEKNEIYVPNDVCLGKDENDLGILLYGTNAVGKTSLIKALGISVIMAQSGMYVPCESFTYSPYKYIFTRIIGNDNIFKGLSTFGVEMSELRVILNNCDNNSLILGDELCSGTETDSALSIFNASIEMMSERKSNFIFATHFHELPHLKTMKKITGVKCKHLKVQFNYETQKMYYDRKMHDGQGETIYGLEVCKSLKLPQEFIERCYDIRNEYMDNKDNILLLKTSKYNKDKIRNICEFCNKKLGTEIHHLQYQCDANENKYIENSFHKNHNANLSSVCSECHKNIHSLNLRYEKRKTMDGNYEFILKKCQT